MKDQGITVTADNNNAYIGATQFGFGANGNSPLGAPLISSGDLYGVVTLSFSTPISSFGAGFNYVPNFVPAPPVGDQIGQLFSIHHQVNRADQI